jgi:hypothetical protein
VRFWLSRRLFGSRVRLGVSFGPEDFRRPRGKFANAVLEVLKFLIAIPLALVTWASFYLAYLIITTAGNNP